jgi:hypothetical protein
MIRNVLTLFKTFVEIIFLRKGPDDVPQSSVLFVMVAAIWLLVGIVAVMVVESYQSSGLLIDLILAFVGLGIYAIVVNLFGKGARLMRCFTTILGCGIVFSIAQFGGRLGFPLLLAEVEVDWALLLVWLWSIPVEGHIIARTIERQWFVGFLVALAVLFVQLNLLAALKPMLGPVA